MAHNTLISGTGRAITGGTDLIGGTVYKKKKGRTLVNGTGYDVSFSNGTPLSSLGIGDSVYTNFDGAKTEFLVAQKGLPSSMYDSSCDGVWLLRKDLCEGVMWDSGNENDYKNSDIHAYLNGDFLNRFDADILSKIKTVKIPYVNGIGSSGTVASGGNGLSTKAFILSAFEYGFTLSMGISTNFLKFEDGACLSYFSGAGQTDSRRIGYLDGTASVHATRSPGSGKFPVFLIGATGGNYSYNANNAYPFRPTIILPHDALYDPETLMILA